MARRNFIAFACLAFAFFLAFTKTGNGNNVFLGMGFNSPEDTLAGFALTMTLPVFILLKLSKLWAVCLLWLFFIVQYAYILLHKPGPLTFLNPFYTPDDCSFAIAILISVAAGLLVREEKAAERIAPKIVFVGEEIHQIEN